MDIVPKRKRYTRWPKPKNWRELEKWKWAVDYDHYYQVSNMGRVKRVDKKVNVHGQKFHRKVKILKPFIARNWTVHVKLIKADGKPKLEPLRNVVGKTWIRPYRGGQIVLKDPDDIWDCSIYNLREKALHTKKYNQKLSEEESLELQRRYWEDPRRGKKIELAKQYRLQRTHLTKIIRGNCEFHNKIWEIHHGTGRPMAADRKNR
jgi:hypothetical protein